VAVVIVDEGLEISETDIAADVRLLVEYLFRASGDVVEVRGGTEG
jgi:hypothetical protein